MKKMKILIVLLLVTAMIISVTEAIDVPKANTGTPDKASAIATPVDLVFGIPDQTLVLTEIKTNAPERAVDVEAVQKAFLAKKPISCCNTKWEELKAVGFYPPERRFEAIIHIKQKNGYGANEFVSFWIDWNNNSVFTDDEIVGIENVNIKNPGNVQLPLEYAVYTDVVPPSGTTGVRKAKVTLSWLNPVFYPYTAPIFGNSITTNIRFDPIS
jgi:hypothetical protein